MLKSKMAAISSIYTMHTSHCSHLVGTIHEPSIPYDDSRKKSSDYTSMMIVRIYTSPLWPKETSYVLYAYGFTHIWL